MTSRPISSGRGRRVKQNHADLEAPQFTRAELTIHPSTTIARGHVQLDGQDSRGPGRRGRQGPGRPALAQGHDDVHDPPVHAGRPHRPAAAGQPDQGDGRRPAHGAARRAGPRDQHRRGEQDDGRGPGRRRLRPGRGPDRDPIRGGQCRQGSSRREDHGHLVEVHRLRGRAQPHPRARPGAVQGRAVGLCSSRGPRPPPDRPAGAEARASGVGHALAADPPGGVGREGQGRPRPAREPAHGAGEDPPGPAPGQGLGGRADEGRDGGRDLPAGRGRARAAGGRAEGDRGGGRVDRLDRRRRPADDQAGGEQAGLRRDGPGRPPGRGR